MQQKFVLFDFDGVIADSFESCYEVQKLMCPHVTVDQYRKQFEGNINDWQEPMQNHRAGCRDDVDFFAEYIPKMKGHVQMIPEMKDVIIELKRCYNLIVISSTITSPIQEFLERHAVAHFFSQIMGNDIHKSKVEKIKVVLEKHETRVEDCVFITDTLGDMREASRVGIGSIGVTWGFHTPQTLLQGKPFRLVEQPRDLLIAVPEYFAAQR